MTLTMTLTFHTFFRACFLYHTGRLPFSSAILYCQYSQYAKIAETWHKNRQKTDKHGRKMYRNRTFWDCSAISISKFLPAKWNAMIDVKFNIHSVSVFKKRICDTLPTMKMISHLDKIKNKRQATLVLINPAFSAAALFAQITLCLQTEPEL